MRATITLDCCLVCLAQPVVHAQDKQFAAGKKKLQLSRRPTKSKCLPRMRSCSWQFHIRGWNLAKSFPGVPTNNRGFGGSQIADVVHFAPRIIANTNRP